MVSTDRDEQFACGNDDMESTLPRQAWLLPLKSGLLDDRALHVR